MNKLNKYMNDPDIVNEPMPLREVHAIRLMHQDETKGMTRDERQAYFEKKSGKAIKEFGLERLLVENAAP